MKKIRGFGEDEPVTSFSYFSPRYPSDLSPRQICLLDFLVRCSIPQSFAAPFGADHGAGSYLNEK